jgi:hypothetical protein
VGVRPLPAELLHGPFTRARAAELGVTSRMLQGRRFVRVHHEVWLHRDCLMTTRDRIMAAKLALPADAHLTGITRLQEAGLDFGPKRPLRFVIGRDHHLVLDDVFLHRTKRLPPVDEVGVVVPAAFLAYCARARVIDAIKVGDWLLHGGHMTVADLRTLALSALWRDGAHEAIRVADHLCAGSRSLMESETRAVLAFAGLPVPSVNVAVDVKEEVEVIGDFVYREHGLVVEYEGTHHQEDRAQYVADLERYALMRAAGVPYLQVTKEKLRRPKTLVGEVYRALVARGYPGPPPEFGEDWRPLFLPVSAMVGPRRDRIAGRAVS